MDKTSRSERAALAKRIAPKQVPDSRVWMMLACIALFSVAIEARRRRLSQG